MQRGSRGASKGGDSRKKPTGKFDKKDSGKKPRLRKPAAPKQRRPHHEGQPGTAETTQIRKVNKRNNARVQPTVQTKKSNRRKR